MAIIVRTDYPRKLLSAIRTSIDENVIRTWAYDEDGDFTHTAEQWTRRAWLHPRVREDSLVFSIIPPRTQRISKVLYGVYHGRFIEMLLTHFDERFDDARATALPTSADKIEGQSS